MKLKSQFQSSPAALSLPQGNVRGGGYLSTRDEVRGAARASALYAEKARTLGFRCARAP